MSEAHNSGQPSYGPAHKLYAALSGRQWPAFFTELVLIVVGILIALAIDGRIQERQDSKTEIAYLHLLLEDLDQIENTLQQFADFETANMEIAAAVYRRIAVDKLPADVDELQKQLAALGGRRTLQIVSAAYTDLTSTGNLQLISNPALRGQIVRYFAEAGRIELVIEKNNSAFIDGTYFRFLIEAGITPFFVASPEPMLATANRLAQQLLGNAAQPVDEILTRPPEAGSWDDIRRQVLFRLRIAAVGATLGGTAIEQTRELRSEIGTELARRDSGEENSI